MTWHGTVYTAAVRYGTGTGRYAVHVRTPFIDRDCVQDVAYCVSSKRRRSTTTEASQVLFVSVCS